MSGFYEYERIRHKNRDIPEEDNSVTLKVNKTLLGDMLQTLSDAGIKCSVVDGTLILENNNAEKI